MHVQLAHRLVPVQQVVRIRSAVECTFGVFGHDVVVNTTLLEVTIFAHFVFLGEMQQSVLPSVWPRDVRLTLIDVY